LAKTQRHHLTKTMMQKLFAIWQNLLLALAQRLFKEAADQQ
jgi:hypothetical protein